MKSRNKRKPYKSRKEPEWHPPKPKKASGIFYLKLAIIFFLSKFLFIWVFDPVTKEDLTELECTVRNTSTYEESYQQSANRFHDTYLQTTKYLSYTTHEYPNIRFVREKKDVGINLREKIYRDIKEGDIIYIHVPQDQLYKYAIKKDGGKYNVKFYSLKSKAKTYIDVDKSRNELDENMLIINLLFLIPSSLCMLLWLMKRGNKKSPI